MTNSNNSNDAFCSPSYVPEWCRVENLPKNAWSSAWTAESVFDRYKKIVSDDRLDLQKAWAALDRRYKSMPEDLATEFRDYFLFKLLVMAVRFPKEEKLSRADRASIVKEAKDLTQKLGALISRTESDMPLTLLTHVLNDVDEGTYIAFSEVDAELLPRVTLSRAIEAYGEWIVDQFDPGRGHIERPTSGTPEIRYFCHEMTMLFCNRLGQPLYAVTAAFASANFNDTIDPDYVRLSVKDTVAKWNRNRKYLRELKTTEEHN